MTHFTITGEAISITLATMLSWTQMRADGVPITVVLATDTSVCQHTRRKNDGSPQPLVGAAVLRLYVKTEVGLVASVARDADPDAAKRCVSGYARMCYHRHWAVEQSQLLGIVLQLHRMLLPLGV
jgi:hypothetical protein